MPATNLSLEADVLQKILISNIFLTTGQYAWLVLLNANKTIDRGKSSIFPQHTMSRSPQQDKDNSQNNR